MNITTNQKSRPHAKLLRRAADGRVLGGVAAGIATFFALNVTYVRIALVALAIFGGAGVPLYLAAWLLIPAEGSDSAIADEFAAQAGRRLS